MESLALVALAAVGAFYIGRLGERARTAHQMYDSYKRRVTTSLTEWIKDTALSVVLTAVVVLIIVSALAN